MKAMLAADEPDANPKHNLPFKPRAEISSVCKP
jgi:hypothetical protein